MTAIVDSLRNVIAPAIAEPYPKAQAYMAAVILEFVARQVDERGDIVAGKQAALNQLLDELARIPAVTPLAAGPAGATEAQLCDLIERLYSARDALGAEAFAAANATVRAALRRLLDQELTIVGKDAG